MHLSSFPLHGYFNLILPQKKKIIPVCLEEIVFINRKGKEQKIIEIAFINRKGKKFFFHFLKFFLIHWTWSATTLSSFALIKLLNCMQKCKQQIEINYGINLKEKNYRRRCCTCEKCNATDSVFIKIFKAALLNWFPLKGFHQSELL